MGRDDSDEAYIISLCDEVLKLVAIRQQKFEFLVGDIGKNGHQRRLPVDAYYPSLLLAIEYREKQHSEAVAIFDKPDRMTISGIHRGQQRALYDQRRRDVLSKHGIKLVEFSASDFNHDRRQRLLRARPADADVVKRVLEPYL